MNGYLDAKTIVKSRLLITAPVLRRYRSDKTPNIFKEPQNKSVIGIQRSA
jgi:hypothetical protein